MIQVGSTPPYRQVVTHKTHTQHNNKTHTHTVFVRAHTHTHTHTHTNKHTFMQIGAHTMVNTPTNTDTYMTALTEPSIATSQSHWFQSHKQISVEIYC